MFIVESGYKTPNPIKVVSFIPFSGEVSLIVSDLWQVTYFLGVLVLPFFSTNKNDLSQYI
jgi:hypothetical protein